MSTRTPPCPHLLLADGAYNGRAIMALAHQLARENVARAAARGVVRCYRSALKIGLTSAWQTAQTHRYCHQRDQRLAALPAAHAALLNERTAALMVAARVQEVRQRNAQKSQIHVVNGQPLRGDDLRRHVNAFYEKHIWPQILGPSPISQDTKVPGEFVNWLPEFGKHAHVFIPATGSMVDEANIWYFVARFRTDDWPWPEKWGPAPGSSGFSLHQRFADAALAPFVEIEPF